MAADEARRTSEHTVHQQHNDRAEQQADDEGLPPCCCAVTPPRHVHALTRRIGLTSGSNPANQTGNYVDHPEFLIRTRLDA